MVTFGGSSATGVPSLLSAVAFWNTSGVDAHVVIILTELSFLLLFSLLLSWVASHLKSVLVHRGLDSLEVELFKASEFAGLGSGPNGVLGSLRELGHLIN